MEIRTGIARSRVRGDIGPESGDIEIYYEDMGDPNDPAVLLIMGLGAQLLLWRKGFCEKLVDQGLRVIRYDNRDVGLSTKVTAVTPVRRWHRGWSARSSACAARPSTRWRTWPTTPRRCSTT